MFKIEHFYKICIDIRYKNRKRLVYLFILYIIST